MASFFRAHAASHTPDAAREQPQAPGGAGEEPNESWLERDTDPVPDPQQLLNRHARPARLGYKRAWEEEDSRLKYIVRYLDVRGQRVLELGPLHAHYTMLLDKLGALEIVAVESRPQNIEVCEKVKARYRLDSTTFVCQDIEKLCNRTESSQFSPGFDLVFNVGVLYHLPDPGAALQWCREQGEMLFLCTHYFETRAPDYYRSSVFAPVEYRFEQRVMTALSYEEGGLEDRLSGMSPRSVWLREDDLIALVRAAGYGEVHVLGRDVESRLPHITLLAFA